MDEKKIKSAPATEMRNMIRRPSNGYEQMKRRQRQEENVITIFHTPTEKMKWNRKT